MASTTPTRVELVRQAKEKARELLEDKDKSKIKRNPKRKLEKTMSDKCKEALNMMHAETLANLKSFPLGKGTVDRKLTQLSTADPSGTGSVEHEELEYYTENVPYALQKLLHMYKTKYLDTIELMKTPEYRKRLLEQVDAEKKRKEQLTMQKIQLEKDIQRLGADFDNIINGNGQRVPSVNRNADVVGSFGSKRQKNLQEKIIEVIDLE